jgi:hypothetical protein
LKRAETKVSERTKKKFSKESKKALDKNER